MEGVTQSATAYFARPGVNWTSLKRMDDSALAYKHGIDNPRPDTADLAIGRVVHALVFEPETLKVDYAIYEGGDRRGKEWDAFKAANEGKTIFKPNELTAAAAMAAAVKAHDLVKPYLKGGKFEQVMEWADPITGMRCKCRTDWTVENIETLVDLKTTRSINMRRFAADVGRFGYHGQHAHYGDGCTHALGWTPKRHLLIAVEKLAPYDVAVYELDGDAIEAVKAKVVELMEKLQWCRDNDRWPGRQFDWDAHLSREETLTLPGWVFGGGEPEVTYDEEE